MSVHSNSSRRQFLGYGSVAALGLLPGLSGSDTASAYEPAPTDCAPVGEHELPKLPYDFDALEPHIDAATMRLHHGKHHGGAVRGLNRTEKALADSAKKGEFASTKVLCRSLAYYASSHVLHSIFWTNMTAKGGGRPDGKLMAQISKDFGSFAALENMFLAASNSAPASGWGMLAFHAGFDRLVVLQVEDHEKLGIWNATPILVCDVWEHAYYLKYQNRRKEWTRTFMKELVNWKNVEERFTAARD